MILPSEQLSIFIHNELKNLDQLAQLAGARIASARKESQETDAFIESAALHLQSFYTAVEQILTRIAENIDENIPDGSAWHIDLLRQMTYEIPGRRPPVLRKATYGLLDELRGFRHRVRNLYTYQLNPERVTELVNHLTMTLKELSDDLVSFIDFLDAL